MSQALDQVDNALWDGLEDNDSKIGPLISKLADWLDDAVKTNQLAVDKLKKKASGFILRLLAKDANKLDKLFTDLLTWIQGMTGQNEWVLTGLAVKAGLIDAGQDLDDVTWDIEEEPSLGPEYGGTLVLDCRTLAEQLTPLLEVLREIRDRLPPTPQPVAGEIPEDVSLPNLAGGDMTVTLPFGEKEIA